MAKHNHLVLDFEDGEIIGIALPAEGGGGTTDFSNYRRRVELIGVKNEVNKVYTTPVKFDRSTILEVVIRNGVEQNEGIAADFIVSESSPGTGYDTITFTEAPFLFENLVIDYLIKT